MPETAQQYERVPAGEIRPGDRVARSRTHPFHTVTAIERTPTCVWLSLEGAGRSRPRLTASWWREVPDAG